MTQCTWIVVIPARLASSRLPGKPLIDICGMSMIERTYKQVLAAVGDPSRIYIATDAQEIVSHCHEFTKNVVLTSDSCLTGTDRIAEVSQTVHADLYFNIQGDEPILPSSAINYFINQTLALNQDVVVTAVKKIVDSSDYLNRSIPKMVFTRSHFLMYSSRAPIPSSKDGSMSKDTYKHVCMYAFTRDSLKKFAAAGSKTTFEETEDLEINRFLELDIPVKILEVFESGKAVDTLDDLNLVRRIIQREQSLSPNHY